MSSNLRLPQNIYREFNTMPNIPIAELRQIKNANQVVVDKVSKLSNDMKAEVEMKLGQMNHTIVENLHGITILLENIYNKVDMVGDTGAGGCGPNMYERVDKLSNLMTPILKYQKDQMEFIKKELFHLDDRVGSIEDKVCSMENIQNTICQKLDNILLKLSEFDVVEDINVREPEEDMDYLDDLEVV